MLARSSTARWYRTRMLSASGGSTVGRLAHSPETPSRLCPTAFSLASARFLTYSASQHFWQLRCGTLFHLLNFRSGLSTLQVPQTLNYLLAPILDVVGVKAKFTTGIGLLVFVECEFFDIFKNFAFAAFEFGRSWRRHIKTNSEIMIIEIYFLVYIQKYLQIVHSTTSKYQT